MLQNILFKQKLFTPVQGNRYLYYQERNALQGLQQYLQAISVTLIRAKNQSELTAKISVDYICVNELCMLIYYIVMYAVFKWLINLKPFPSGAVLIGKVGYKQKKKKEEEINRTKTCNPILEKNKLELSHLPFKYLHYNAVISDWKVPLKVNIIWYCQPFRFISWVAL